MYRPILFTHDTDSAIAQLVEELKPDRIVVLCDSHTVQCALPLLTLGAIQEAPVITIGAGENHKDIATLTQVWHELGTLRATRHSLLINLGGGMVSDLGGLAAATYKRGMAFVNIPTTLLGCVDAAIGGKTGINFDGLKNEIGVFCEARGVVITTRFLATLPREELLSGYGEMIKCALLNSRTSYERVIGYDIAHHDETTLLPLVQEAVQYKENIVSQDPHESSLRKVLNAGHTIGHAIESHALRHNHPVPHGYAVAWGLICELLLAHRALGFETAVIYELAHYIEHHYGRYYITCDDYDELLAYMRHDKKNKGEEINFVLLREIGSPVIDCTVPREEIAIALDVYRDLFHL